MDLFGVELHTPAQVAAWLESGGAGMPPHYEGTGQALRFDADDRALADAGALLALESGSPAARSEAICALRGVVSASVDAATASILATPPPWWTEADARRGGTFGEQFLVMATYGSAARDPASSAAMLRLSRGLRVEDEVMWAVLAWRPAGAALDVLLARLGSGVTYPADRVARVALRLSSNARFGELVAAVKAHHGADVRDALVAAAPAAAALWR